MPEPGLLPQFDLVARLYLLLVLAGLPYLALRGVPDEEEVTRLAEARRFLYVSTALSLVVLALVTRGVAAWRGLSLSAVGWRGAAPASAVLWGAAAAAGGLAAVWAITRIGRALGARESPLVRLLIPTTRGERWEFLAVSAVAAVCEEYVFRGYLLHGLAGWTGSPWAAVALTSVSFGVGHGYQNALGILRAAVLGGVLAATVLATGSVFPAVGAHFVINAAVGLWGWERLLPEGGLRPEREMEDEKAPDRDGQPRGGPGPERGDESERGDRVEPVDGDR